LDSMRITTSVCYLVTLALMYLSFMTNISILIGFIIVTYLF
jgi:hypothetical protein